MKNQNQTPEKNNQHESGRTPQSSAHKNLADGKSEKDFSKNPKTEAPKKTDSRTPDREREEQAKRKDAGKH